MANGPCTASGRSHARGARGPRHNASALHMPPRAAISRSIRALLDAGADPNDDRGDDERGRDRVGDASFPNLGAARMDVVSLLLERGARHHIFSAMATGDLDVIRALVEQQPEALDQRLSPDTTAKRALQFSLTRNRPGHPGCAHRAGRRSRGHRQNGQTALEFALLRGDRTAAARLVLRARSNRSQRRRPRGRAPSGFASSIRGGDARHRTEDVAATLAWYTSIGFTEEGRFPTDGPVVFWGRVTLGKAELTFDVREAANRRAASACSSRQTACGSCTGA